MYLHRVCRLWVLPGNLLDFAVCGRSFGEAYTLNNPYLDLCFGIFGFGIPLVLQFYWGHCVTIAHQTHRSATVCKGISYSVLQI